MEPDKYLRANGRAEFMELKNETGWTAPKLSRWLKGEVRAHRLHFYPPFHPRSGPKKRGIYVDAMYEFVYDLIRMGRALDDVLGDLGPGYHQDLGRMEQLLQPQKIEAVRRLLGTLYLFRLTFNRDPWEEA